MSSEQNRFRHQERRKRWRGCLGALSCFKSQKGGKRIVPASRIPEGNAANAQPNGAQAASLVNQGNGIPLSLLAPPSSPASFTNSALPSTAQSPNCMLSLSANSPGGPSSAMYATGPYAHDTQLVSPPIFSTFTTEPSTAPLTPPPELAHHTTPSSPDVPYARFFTSSMRLKTADKTHYNVSNDLHSTYSLYPGSPASTLRSPISRTSGDGMLSPQNGKCSRGDSSNAFGYDANGTPQGSNFFCPATFAKFYLDQDSAYNGGRLSVSKESEIYPTNGNGNQNRQNRSPKQDMEELEAYRASFGFSADEVITTSQYVEITNVMDDSFSMKPSDADAPTFKESEEHTMQREGQELFRTQTNVTSQKSSKSETEPDDEVVNFQAAKSSKKLADHKRRSQPSNASGSNKSSREIQTDEEVLLLSRVGSLKTGRKYHFGHSSSDAEIEYRRGRSLREARDRLKMA